MPRAAGLLVAICLLGAAAIAGAAPARDAQRVKTVGCDDRSEAGFPRAFSEPRNLVVGPLVMIGAAEQSSESAVTRFGGGKFPLLVANRHRVRVRVDSDGASLAYDPATHAERTVESGRRVMRFVACRRGSGSRGGRRRVTFWSGFVLTEVPQCVRLRVWVDGRRSPRRARIPLGRECGG